MTHFNLIIRHGLLVDGSGAPAQIQDIAVSNGKIAIIDADILATVLM